MIRQRVPRIEGQVLAELHLCRTIEWLTWNMDRGHFQARSLPSTRRIFNWLFCRIRLRLNVKIKIRVAGFQIKFHSVAKLIPGLYRSDDWQSTGTGLDHIFDCAGAELIGRGTPIAGFQWIGGTIALNPQQSPQFEGVF